MAVVAITPSATTNAVYGWLRDNVGIRLVNASAAIQSLIGKFNLDLGRTPIVKERACLFAATTDNATNNIITALENVFDMTVNVLTPAVDLALAPAATGSAVPTDDNGGDIVYTSSDESVATVDVAGLVTAVAAGTATITATELESDDFYQAVVTSLVVVA
jgi:hypothetical protein